MSADLPRYNAMCEAIEGAHEVDEVDLVQDKERALALYVAIANNIEPEKQAVEIRLRAERRLRQLRGQTPRSSDGASR